MADNPGQGTASLSDVVTQLQGIVRQMSALVMFLKAGQTTGSFTMPAAATFNVPAPGVQGGSNITLTARNAAAGTLVGSAKSPYVSAKSAGVGFTVATASGAAAAGTEIFDYLVNTV